MVVLYLDRVLGSSTKVNALAALMANPNKTVLEVELAKEAGCSVSEVNRQMKDLVGASIVIMQRVGKGKLYQINTQHFLYKPLSKLFRGLEEVYREIASKITAHITRRHEVKAIILFGSLVRGKIRSDLVEEPSDLDLIVIARDKERAERVKQDMVSFINSEISMQYGMTVYPIVLSLEEYKTMLEKDPFIIDVHAKGELLHGEKPRRFS